MSALCPLLRDERKCLGHALKSEFDPKATSVGQSTRAPLMLQTAAICFAISAKNGLDTVGGSVQTQANSSTKSISFDFHGIIHRVTSHLGNSRDSYSPLCLRRDRAGIDLCVRN